MSKYWSAEELREQFSTSFDFYEAATQRKDLLKNFFIYIFNRFEIGSQFSQRNEEISKCFDYILQQSNDSEVYLYLRQRQQETKPSSQTSFEELTKIEFEKDRKTIAKKAKDIRDICKNERISFGSASHHQIQTVLDIGTEKLAYLDELENHLYLNRGNVKGINIDIGFCHYDESFNENQKDPRFKLYDGKNIPFEDNSFDLITIFSVIHHIPTVDFETVAKEIYRVCNGYVYFKDVDLSDKVSASLFRIQHYLFEGIMIPFQGNSFGYLNSSVTKQSTLQILQTVGFEIVFVNEWHNFNGTYVALLKKKQSNISLRSKRPNNTDENLRDVKHRRKDELSTSSSIRSGSTDQLEIIFPNSSRKSFSYDKLKYIPEALTESSTQTFAKKTKDWIVSVKKKYFPNSSVNIIIDGTAGLGSNTIGFVKTEGSFDKCIAVEMNPLLTECLEHNLKLYELDKYVHCVTDDILEWMQREYVTNYKDALVFLDPSVEKNQQMGVLQIIDDLFLKSKQSTTTHSVVQFVKQLISEYSVPVVVLKVPSNFQTDQFKSLNNITVEENTQNKNWKLIAIIHNNNNSCM